MNNGTVGVLAFVFGAAVGSLVAWQLLKAKYERIAQEEIDSVKEAYSKQNDKKKAEVNEESEVVEPEKPKRNDRVAYKSFVSEVGYTTNYNDIQPQKTEEGGTEIEDIEKPYVIEPEEYGDILGYEQREFTWYADEILTDDYDDIVEDADDLIGLENLRHIGEYEDDCVYIRDDVLKTDYQVVKEYRTYDEMHSINRYPADE